MVCQDRFCSVVLMIQQLSGLYVWPEPSLQFADVAGLYRSVDAEQGSQGPSRQLLLGASNSNPTYAYRIT